MLWNIVSFFAILRFDSAMVHATRNTWQKYVETMAREDKDCHIVTLSWLTSWIPMSNMFFWISDLAAFSFASWEPFPLRLWWNLLRRDAKVYQVWSRLQITFFFWGNKPKTWMPMKQTPKLLRVPTVWLSDELTRKFVWDTRAHNFFFYGTGATCCISIRAQSCGLEGQFWMWCQRHAN